jgi:nicotinic acid phosphoribosyltransferase
MFLYIVYLKNKSKEYLNELYMIFFGYDKEIDCYVNLMNSDNIGSYVADCYNFKRAIAEMIVPIAKANPSKIFVSRPDSGDMSENTRWVIEQTKKQETSNVSLIHGDSVKPLISKEQIDICWKMGVNPSTFMLFGVGGYGRNISTRDALSASYKLSSIRKSDYGNWSPVVKLSDTITKLSVPGPNKIVREAGVYENTVRVDNEDFTRDMRVVYYDGSGDSLRHKFTPYCYEQFSVIEDRVLNDFNDMSKYPANYGTYKNTPWSQAIKDIQAEYVKNYKE